MLELYPIFAAGEGHYSLKSQYVIHKAELLPQLQ